MIVLQWCKMQLLCLVILTYVGIIFIREGRNLNRLTGRSNCCKIFDAMFLMAVFAVLFDGITACSVNFLDVVPRTVNLLLHLGMFLSYLLYLLLLLLYWVSTTVGRIQNQRSRILCVMPFVLAVILTIAFLPGLEFRQGQYTNYSMGWSVYVCFATVGIYFLLTVGLIIAKFGSIRVNKREALLTTLICILFIVALQIIFPEFLATSMALTMTTISIYINMENPKGSVGQTFPSAHGSWLWQMCLMQFRQNAVTGTRCLLKNATGS